MFEFAAQPMHPPRGQQIRQQKQRYACLLCDCHGLIVSSRSPSVSRCHSLSLCLLSLILRFSWRDVPQPDGVVRAREEAERRDRRCVRILRGIPKIRSCVVCSVLFLNCLSLVLSLIVLPYNFACSVRCQPGWRVFSGRYERPGYAQTTRHTRAPSHIYTHAPRHTHTHTRTHPGKKQGWCPYFMARRLI